ncbi:melanocyte-stimulating hormone receptor-like [Hydractinia symbiolongicarpus]|uniref:melanocyte-stimulating hormone receptor-like n=1 Tax=Hydractinia symbiolongicarpus TaxID=13093 RepID=UPI00254A1A95|nr:melanocyte-stimulating hormone receptor-like [Hydractinia symbiolongicarpus]
MPFLAVVRRYVYILTKCPNVTKSIHHKVIELMRDGRTGAAFKENALSLNLPRESALKMVLVSYFLLVLIFLALCLHLLALFSLCKHKKQNKNQKVLLINLSVTEILLLMFGIYNEIVYMHPYVSRWKLWHQIFTYLHSAGNLALLFAMFLIITDRFLCISLHIKYGYIVTKQRLVKFTIAAWIISGLTAFLVIIVEDIDLHQYSYAVTITNGVYVLIAVVVYSIIGLHLKRRRRNFQQNVRNGESITNAKQFIVPFLLVFTFIIFSSIPKCITTWCVLKCNKDNIDTEFIFKIRGTLLICGFIIDPLIYVFLNKPLRDVALNYLCCKRFHSTTSDNLTALRNIAVVNGNIEKVSD